MKNQKDKKWEREFIKDFYVDRFQELPFESALELQDGIMKFISNLLEAQEKEIEEKLSRIEEIRCEEMLKAEREKTLKEIKKIQKLADKEQALETDMALQELLSKLK